MAGVITLVVALFIILLIAFFFVIHDDDNFDSGYRVICGGIVGFLAVWICVEMYNTGYKNGQVDVMKNNIKIELKINDDKSSTWVYKEKLTDSLVIRK